MSVTSENGAAFASPSIIGDASPGDYFALLKPRVMSLVVFTGLSGSGKVVVKSTGTITFVGTSVRKVTDEIRR